MQNSQGKNNTQIAGDNNSLHVENNFVSSLKIDPKDIELKASVNNGWYVPFTIIFLACIGVCFLFSISYSMGLLLNINASLAVTVSLIISSILTVAIMLPYMDFMNNMFFKFSGLNITYKDGTIEYKGKQYKFYDDIWDIEFKKGKFGMSARLIIYLIDEKLKYSPIPPEFEISFMVNSRAKYVYDSFHSEERRKKYLENNK